MRRFVPLEEKPEVAPETVSEETDKEGEASSASEKTPAKEARPSVPEGESTGQIRASRQDCGPEGLG
jgi:hypothetical protein